jgi:hypothetical protein
LFGLSKEGKVYAKQTYEVHFLEENDDGLDWLIFGNGRFPCELNYFVGWW